MEAVRELAGALSTNRDGTKYWTYQDYTGEAIYKKLMDDLFMDRPRSEVPDKNGRQKAASLALLDSGIKGIRYADGYTRGKAEEEQTYNYVIFDGKDIKITAFADESTGERGRIMRIRRRRFPLSARKRNPSRSTTITACPTRIRRTGSGRRSLIPAGCG